MMKRVKKSVLVLVLIFALVITVIPNTIAAMESEAEETTVILTASDVISENVDIITEDTASTTTPEEISTPEDILTVTEDTEVAADPMDTDVTEVTEETKTDIEPALPETEETTKDTVLDGEDGNIEEVEIAPKPLPEIKIKKNKLSVKKGKTAKISFTFKNCKKKDIIWKSSKKKVVSVDSKGRVKGKAGGTVTITARVKGTNIKDKIKVTCINYYTMRVRTTGYCNGSCCVGSWAGGRTASGKMPRANHTIAVDTRKIKLGTKIRIGNITYVAEDTGGAIKGNNMDIYYSSHSKAQAHGVKYQTAKIYY